MKTETNTRKTAVITGGSRGIGYAIAKRLAAEGMRLVIAASGPEAKYAEGLARLKAEGAEFIYVQTDIAKSADRERLIGTAAERFGRIDILVNNAGVAPLERRDLLDMSEESFDRVIGINTKGNLFLTQLAAKQMLRQEQLFPVRGKIINISSCSAEVSSVNRGEYCVSKAGVSMLTRLFADRLAADNILVHEIRPGIILTDMTEAAREKYDRLIAEGTFPIPRWGTPEDVAEMCALFCSDKINYTTGNYVDVDGGFHIRRL